jgi:hypothetical protein
MLISLCHFVRKAGARGLLLTLDLRPALRVVPVGEGGLRYSPAAVMDLYEVLREIIDDIEHLPGLFLLGLADQTLLAGDRRWTLTRPWRCASSPTCAPATGRTRWLRW